MINRYLKKKLKKDGDNLPDYPRNKNEIICNFKV